MVSLGHHGHRRLSLTGHHHGPVEEQQRPDSAGGPEDETTEVEPEQGNVLSHIISNLRPGADLSRVVLPTFILEPRSMLERITNFMAHPETLLPMPDVEDPVQRFVSVVKFYLSGWHIKSPGVKKPLNPILGERYTCYWEYPDHTRGYYISEQTSHHPPKSSYFFMAPEHHIRIDGTLKPRSKFLGNSAASMMEGIAILRILNRGKSGRGENYILTQPNMYARGILFGKMKYELGDHSLVRCPENHLVADIEFKTKGWVSGGYNAIGGTIKNEKTGQVLYELSGMWSGEMFIKDAVTGRRELLFDARSAKPTPPSVRPLEEQDEHESPRLWAKVVTALKERNYDVATDEKTRIEEEQRARAAQRSEQGIEWRPKLFRAVRTGPGGSEDGEDGLDWILNAEINGSTPEEVTKQILAVAPILPGQKQSTQSSQPAPSTERSQPAAPAPQTAPVPPRASSTNTTSGHRDESSDATGGDLVSFDTTSSSGHPPRPPTQQSVNIEQPPRESSAASLPAAAPPPAVAQQPSTTIQQPLLPQEAYAQGLPSSVKVIPVDATGPPGAGSWQPTQNQLPDSTGPLPTNNSQENNAPGTTASFGPTATGGAVNSSTKPSLQESETSNSSDGAPLVRIDTDGPNGQESTDIFVDADDGLPH